jgi:hypothetical protein
VFVVALATAVCAFVLPYWFGTCKKFPTDMAMLTTTPYRQFNCPDVQRKTTSPPAGVETAESLIERVCMRVCVLVSSE